MASGDRIDLTAISTEYQIYSYCTREIIAGVRLARDNADSNGALPFDSFRLLLVYLDPTLASLSLEFRIAVIKHAAQMSGIMWTSKMEEEFKKVIERSQPIVDTYHLLMSILAKMIQSDIEGISIVLGRSLVEEGLITERQLTEMQALALSNLLIQAATKKSSS